MSKQSIFSIVLLLVLGITGYLWYGYFQSAPAQDTTQSQNTSLTGIGRFNNIQLDTSLFQDPLFLSLTLPPLIPQPDVTPGRVNPFLPF